MHAHLHLCYLLMSEKVVSCLGGDQPTRTRAARAIRETMVATASPPRPLAHTCSVLALVLGACEEALHRNAHSHILIEDFQHGVVVFIHLDQSFLVDLIDFLSTLLVYAISPFLSSQI